MCWLSFCLAVDPEPLLNLPAVHGEGEDGGGEAGDGGGKQHHVYVFYEGGSSSDLRSSGSSKSVFLAAGVAR